MRCIAYDNIAYSHSCGRTGHHYKDGIAYKFEDDLHETTLRKIEWQPSRTGELSPVAIFDTVEIDGCEVSRASLHNLTFIRELELKPGCRILVSKRNMIIPHVEENLDRDGFDKAIIPSCCPCCGSPTRIQEGKKDKAETLRCDNPGCSYQRLRQFVHFVGKKAMDIEGLSEATLEKFIGMGWLDTFADIYRLDRYRDEIVMMEGFGIKSWRRLWASIQKSRSTTFVRFVVAMDIPMVGRTASRELDRCFGGDLDALAAAVESGFDFTQLNDFGEVLHRNIRDWFKIDKNKNLWKEMKAMANIENKTTATEAKGNPFSGKMVVVTGTLANFTRNSINAKIEELGAKAGSAVSKNTDYLIAGESAGSKLTKAQALGIPVLTEQEFLAMAKGA
jgi:DNA ligase (NAD+)